MKPLKIRIRLTILNSLTVFFILLVLAFSIYYLYQRELSGQVKERLDIQYETVISVLQNSGGDVYDIYHLGQGIPVLITEGENILWKTNRWEYLKLPTENIFEAGYYDLNDFKGERHLVRIGYLEKFNYKVITAQESGEIASDLKNLRAILLLVVPVALILSVLASYYLAGKSLEPVRISIHKAKTINASNLEERLPVINPKDELGELSITFNRMLDEINETFYRLRQFTSDASHELRTPLASIKTMGEVALSRTKIEGEECSESIASMLEEIEHLSNLVEDLLTLTRIDSGVLTERFKEVDLSEIADKVVQDLGILAEEKKQVIESKIEQKIKIKGNRDLIQQTLSNVLHNAIKYTQMGGKISVNLKEENRISVFEVIDNGPGISVDNRSKIFDRFFMEDKSRAKDRGGLGLGLSIVRNTLKLHSGEINLVEDNEPGCHFRIEIPVL